MAKRSVDFVATDPLGIATEALQLAEFLLDGLADAPHPDMALQVIREALRRIRA